MWQKVRLVFLIVIVALVTILMMQNWKLGELQIFFWQLEHVISLLILFIFVLGFAFGWFGRIYYNFQKKRKAGPASSLVSPTLANDRTDWESE